jgi:branched-chain amino acid transport system substrate-binding protein
MKTLSRLMLAVAAAAGSAIASPASAEAVKVGIIAPFSGPSAIFGQYWRAAMDAYRAINGDTAGGQPIDYVYRDLPGPNPAAAKALAQELIIKEHVSYLGGIVYTPNALAIAPLAEEARVPTVIFNAAACSVLQQSKYLVRVSYTLPQVSGPIAKYALDQKLMNIVTMVADFGPGIDADNAFTAQFTAGGGTIADHERIPLSTTDFTPFAQSAKAKSPQAIYAFMPGGPSLFGLIKAYQNNGLAQAGIRFLGSDMDERDLVALGDSAVGLESGSFYSASHDSDVNRAFVSKLPPDIHANPASVEGYDGLHVIYKMIEASKGRSDPDVAINAAKGLAWESPRGPVSISPATRDIVQNVYIREVMKVATGVINRELRTFPAQPDNCTKK